MMYINMHAYGMHRHSAKVYNVAPVAQHNNHLSQRFETGELLKNLTAVDVVSIAGYDRNKLK